MNAVARWVLPLEFTDPRSTKVSPGAPLQQASPKVTPCKFTSETSSNGVIERNFTLNEITGDADLFALLTHRPGYSACMSPPNNFQ